MTTPPKDSNQTAQPHDHADTEPATEERPAHGERKQPSPPARSPTSSRIVAALTPRAIAIAALSSALALGAMYMILAEDVSRLTAEMGADFARELMSAGDGLGCRTAPESWAFTLANGTRVNAYDIEDLSSACPEAPPIDPALVAPITAGADYAFGMTGAGDAQIVFRVADAGPCSLLSLRWTPNRERLRERRLTLAAVVAIALLLVIVSGMLWTVRPLLKRISALAFAARTVGDTSFPATTTGPPDELGTIERGLQDAHQRILEDRQALKSRTRALTRHLSDIAHDLRTPISSLQLALERLSAGDDEADRWLASAVADAVYLETLTDNLRLATQLKEGLLEGRPQQRSNLVDVVERVCSRMGMLARHRRLSLENAHPDRAVWVEWDPLFAERALSNLVHNAVRYGEPDGHVVVILEADTTRFTLEVVDDGPGVPPSEIVRLSERTFRGDSARQRHVQGTGLGLSITGELCARAGFDLTFEPLEPRGLRAVISGHRASAPDTEPSGRTASPES